MPNDLTLLDAVQATREISRDPARRWIVELEDGRTIGALDVQWRLHALATQYLGGRDEETDWLLESWSYTLDALPHKPEALLGGVDWISKKWLLETFMAAENLSWNDPWLQSLDLEYHNIDPARGLFFGLKPAKRIGEWNNLVRQKNAAHHAAVRYPGARPRPGRGRFPKREATVCDQLGFDRLRESRFSRHGRSFPDLCQMRSSNSSGRAAGAIRPGRTGRRNQLPPRSETLDSATQPAQKP